jgi:hypothetical protein
MWGLTLISKRGWPEGAPARARGTSCEEGEMWGEGEPSGVGTGDPSGLVRELLAFSEDRLACWASTTLP